MISPNPSPQLQQLRQARKDLKTFSKDNPHLRRKYQSLNACLEHLDAYVELRGPQLSPAVTAAQQAIWRELEVISKKIKEMQALEDLVNRLFIETGA